MIEENRPGYFRVDKDFPCDIYRVTEEGTDAELFATVTRTEDAPRIVAALNAAVDQDVYL